MSAFEWPIELEEGSDFGHEILWEDEDCNPIDVTGYGAKFQVRNHPDDPTALVTASVSNSRITVAGTTGRFEISIPAASVNAVKNLIENEARFTFIVWPGASTPDVNPKRLLDGPVEFTRTYTS